MMLSFLHCMWQVLSTSSWGSHPSQSLLFCSLTHQTHLSLLLYYLFSSSAEILLTLKSRNLNQGKNKENEWWIWWVSGILQYCKKLSTCPIQENFVTNPHKKSAHYSANSMMWINFIRHSNRVAAATFWRESVFLETAWNSNWFWKAVLTLPQSLWLLIKINTA